jgi:hypothetical protein
MKEMDKKDKDSTPKSKSQPKPKPQSEPQSESQSEPQSESQSEPQSESQSESQSAPQSESQPQPQAPQPQVPQYGGVQINVSAGGQIHNLQINTGGGPIHFDTHSAPAGAGSDEANDHYREAYIEKTASAAQKALFPSLDSYFAVKHDRLHFIYRVLVLPRIENVQNVVYDYMQFGALSTDKVKNRGFSDLVMAIAGFPNEGEKLYRHLVDLCNRRNLKIDQQQWKKG